MLTDTKLSLLKRQSLRGGFISLGSQGIMVLIQLCSIVILARILSPEDYGVLAMVTTFTSFAGMFRDLGLSSAAIQKKDLSIEQQSNLFWLNLAMGVFLTCAVALCAPLVKNFYGKPELLNVTLVLSLNFLISSVSAQHGAMLVRTMQFGRTTTARILGALVTLCVSVTLGLNGYTYWALVWGSLAGAITTSSCFLIFSPFRPCKPTRGSGSSSLVGFGIDVTFFNFVNYFSRNLDDILIGKCVGAEALGIYGKAYQLLMFPIVNLRGPIESVAFPAMSQLDPQSSSFTSYYCSVIRLIGLITMPLMVCMYFSAEEIVLLLLGPNWTDVIPLFSVLALTGFIQPVSSCRGLVLLSSGQSRRYLYAGIISAFTFSVAFFIGISWGSIGLIWAFVIADWMLVLPMQAYATRNTSVGVMDFVRACSLPIVVSIFIICLLFALQSRLDLLTINVSLFAKVSIVLVVAIASLFIDKTTRSVIFASLDRVLKR